MNGHQSRGEREKSYFIFVTVRKLSRGCREFGAGKESENERGKKSEPAAAFLSRARHNNSDCWLADWLTEWDSPGEFFIHNSGKSTLSEACPIYAFNGECIIIKLDQLFYSLLIGLDLFVPASPRFPTAGNFEMFCVCVFFHPPLSNFNIADKNCHQYTEHVQNTSHNVNILKLPSPCVI